MGSKLLLFIALFWNAADSRAERTPDNPFAAFFNSLTGAAGNMRELGQMNCDSKLYNASTRGACSSCSQPVNEWRKKFPDLVDRFVSTDNSITAGATTAVGATPGGVRGALTAFQSGRTTASTGADASRNRAQNAAGARTEFDKCREDIGKACNGKRLAPEDTRVAQAVLKACEDAARGTGQFADQKKKDGMGLGNIGELLNAASKALGAMQPQQGNQSPSNISQPDNAGVSGASAEKPEKLVSAIDGKNGIAGASVAFGTPGAGSKVTADGNPPGQGSLTGLGVPGDRHLASASSDLGPHGGAPGASTSAGGGGGGGLAGGGNATGASRPGDGETASSPGSGGSYEVNPGGGGRAIVGLKPSKGDVAELAAEGAPPPLDPAKLDAEGNKDPALEAAAAEDVLAHDSESIFLRVHSKYSLIKGSGKL